MYVHIYHFYYLKHISILYIAGGGVDCGYPLPIMYEYTFLAGETCATPVDPIPIIDDRISERDERFKFDIIRTLLPLGVRVSRNSITITIKDNDSKFKYIIIASYVCMHYYICTYF